MSCDLSSSLPQPFSFPLGVMDVEPEYSDNSIEAGLEQYLSTHPLVSCLVADRIFPYYRPRISELPAIVYEITDDPIESITGQSGGSTATIVLDCWGESFSDSVRVASACRRALQAFRGYMGNVAVSGVWYHGYDDEAQDPKDNSGVYLFGRTVTFHLTYLVEIHDH